MNSPARMPFIAKPSAMVPIGMSLAAFAVVMADVALFGVQRRPDEGAAAHVWQILMAGQAPIILFHALKWLPRRPKEGLFTIGLQSGAAVLALAPVYLLGL